MGGECPVNASGQHVFAVRGPKSAGGWYTCRCGKRRSAREQRAVERADRVRFIRRRQHVQMACPCGGSLEGCDYYADLARLIAVEQHFELTKTRYRHAVEDALRLIERERELLLRAREERDKWRVHVEQHRPEEAAG